MKVKKLDINNFRGFRKATIEFPDSNLAVFIGTNGRGKSSVLDLVAMGLNQITQGLTEKSAHFAEYFIKETDISNGVEGSSNQISFIDDENNMVELSVIARRPGGAGMFSSVAFPKFIKEKLEYIKREKSNAMLDVLLYYRATRFFNHNYEYIIGDIIYDFPQLFAYESAFSKKITNFDDFVNWFRTEEDKENELVKRERNFDLVNPSLQPVRKAITTFFSKLNDFTFANLRVERDLPKSKSLYHIGFNSSLIISKNGQDFRLEQLSDGEKMLLMVVCDIARRLSIANPSLDDPLQGSGIVLIDEIELHLHPQWQREVIPALLTTFPGIQFIVTTHSPQVLSRVDQSDIFLLKDGEVRTISSNPQGLDTNAILEEVMETTKFPKDIDLLIENLFLRIQERNFDQAQEIRRQIVQKTSPEYPILRRADSMMERLKILSQ